ncbi:MAG TPA: sterol desaturase family protein [Burkholderiales bacterium]|nr:sterol desaturase family protein [Burkholderiales bacterium]
MGAVLDALFRLSRTRANYWLEFVLDAALGAAFLVAGIRGQVAPLSAALLLCLGLFVFSFMEYVFHRWLFHGWPPFLAKGHATHHADPRGYDSLPFFLPALVLFCAAGAGALLMPAAAAWLIASGIAFGYITYGLSHFMIHHGRFSRPRIRRWAAHHRIHHHHPESNFGVTSPLWDVLLGTRYVPLRSTAAASARNASDTSTR